MNQCRLGGTSETAWECGQPVSESESVPLRNLISIQNPSRNHFRAPYISLIGRESCRDGDSPALPIPFRPVHRRLNPSALGPTLGASMAATHGRRASNIEYDVMHGTQTYWLQQLRTTSEWRLKSISYVLLAGSAS